MTAGTTVVVGATAGAAMTETEATTDTARRPRAVPARLDDETPTTPPDGPAPTVVATRSPSRDANPTKDLRPAGVAGRLRVAGWVLLLMTVASAAVVLTTYGLLDRQVGQRADAEVARQVEEFTTLARGGADPATGRPFTDTRELLVRRLQRPVTDAEVVVAGLLGSLDQGSGDGAVLRPPRPEPFVLAERRDLLDPIVASPSGTGSSATELGELRWARVDVTARSGGAPDPGVYVVGRLTGADHARTVEIVRTLAWVSLAGVALSAVAAWLVAGRIVAPGRRVHRPAEIAAQDPEAAHGLRRSIAVVRHRLAPPGQWSAEVGDGGVGAPVVTDDDRMGRLLEDLLLLAEAEEPDFLHTEPTSVSELTRDLVARARTLADRRWVVEAVGEGDAVLDRRRVRQAVVELARNAAAHTVPGDEIRLGSTVHVGDDGHRHASFWVTDTGPGVDPALAPSIFERFTRGRSSSDLSGAGLGLAVVKVVADAHGGVVRLFSQPTTGTTFGLELPAPEPGARSSTGTMR